MGRLPSWVAVAFAITTLPVPSTAHAQDFPDSTIGSEGPHGFLFKRPTATIGIRGGFDLRQTHGGVYDFVTSQLTLTKSDFNALHVAGDVGIRLSDPVDLVLGVGYTRTSKPSEFRAYVDQNNLPIAQTTTLSTAPLTLAARWYLRAPGHEIGRFVWIPARVIPYVGVGGGMVHYSLQQAGDFVDFQDLSVFGARLRSAGWTPLGLVMAGVDYSLGPRVFMNADARYAWARGALRQDFVQFSDGIDLSGAQFSLGLHVRL